MSRQLRVVGIEGPGDAVESFHFWRRGRDNPRVLAVPYSSQFFEVCKSLDARVLFVTRCRRIARIVDGNFIVEHRGEPAAGKCGLRFHLAELLATLRLMVDALRFRADVVVTTWSPFSFLFGLLRPLGVRSAVRLHCTLWPKFCGPGGIQRLLHKADGLSLGSACEVVMCVSEDVKRQVRQVTRGRTPRFVDFLPHYRADTFDGIAPPSHGARPFRVMYAGRIERNKGVFDLLHIAAKLRERGRSDIVFELCGDGSDFHAMKQGVARQRLGDVFILHGWCDHERMRTVLSRSHMSIVPTRTGFAEGFAATVAESLLAGRPVVTSSVCPAVEYLNGAVVVVAPDDPAGYEAAIVRLADDAAHFRELQSHCRASARRLLDPATSFSAALHHVLAAIASGKPVTPREWSPQEQPQVEIDSKSPAPQLSAALSR